jgi:ribosome-interacting GTPase 1
MHHVPKPKANQTVVAHIDFNKNNNAASNLKWMSVDENRIHQQKSPHVIKEQKNRRGVRNAATTKLTEKQVIKIKALLKEGKLSNRAIAAKFNVSDMQIGRIVRGENWASVK